MIKYYQEKNLHKDDEKEREFYKTENIIKRIDESNKRELDRKNLLLK